MIFGHRESHVTVGIDAKLLQMSLLLGIKYRLEKSLKYTVKGLIVCL